VVLLRPSVAVNGVGAFLIGRGGRRQTDTATIWIRVAAITKRTLRYTSVLTKGDTKIATGTHTIACVSKKKGERMRSIDFPPDVLARFSVAPGAQPGEPPS